MNILQEVQAERDAQRGKWPDKWSLGEWSALVSHYATRPIVGNLHGLNPAAVRADMVKTAALAVACIEAIDRGQSC